MADALVVAGVAGGDAWQRAQREYFKRCPRPYMRLIAAIQDNDLLSALLACAHMRANLCPSNAAPGCEASHRCHPGQCVVQCAACFAPKCIIDV